MVFTYLRFVLHNIILKQNPDLLLSTCDKNSNLEQVQTAPLAKFYVPVSFGQLQK